MKHDKHVPERTCVACRKILPKQSLVRLVKTDEGLQLDEKGKIAGRGAYLHNIRECWKTALENHSLEKSLRMTLTEEDKANFEKWMNNLPESSNSEK